jgi:hypothetical protein
LGIGKNDEVDENIMFIFRLGYFLYAQSIATYFYGLRQILVSVNHQLKLVALHPNPPMGWIEIDGFSCKGI